jgi:hypothetical protein
MKKQQPEKHFELREGGQARYLGDVDTALPKDKILTVREIEPTRVHCTWPASHNPEKEIGEGFFMAHNLKAVN